MTSRIPPRNHKGVRAQFEEWYRRTERYRLTVKGLTEAFDYGKGGYFYQTVDDAHEAYRAGFAAGRRK